MIRMFLLAIALSIVPAHGYFVSANVAVGAWGGSSAGGTCFPPGCMVSQFDDIAPSDSVLPVPVLSAAGSSDGFAGFAVSGTVAQLGLFSAWGEIFGAGGVLPAQKGGGGVGHSLAGQDAITIASSTLPPGADVLVEIQLVLSVVCSAVDSITVSAAIPGTATLTRSSCLGPATQSATVMGAWQVGDTIFLEHLLDSSFLAESSGGEPPVSAFAFVESRFYLTSLTPDVTFLTASGASYSPVPEPSLLLPGLALLGLGARRRRSPKGE